MKALITGGAGYLGRGTLRRIERDLSNWEPTIYSRDETKQDECRRRYPFARYILGDVRDVDRLRAVMVGHDIVIHTAAMKYIPEAEVNASECVAVNVGGTQAVMRAAMGAGIKKVVGISTDKAVQPVNIYGCSKMARERLIADPAQFEGGPDFTCVRYGNVEGSTGSVIPLFKRQYDEQGLVRITDPDMTRFWMSVDEAIDLVVLALERAARGAIVIPPARAMKIIDVARAATAEDVKVEIIGVRPGEKQHEMLIHYEESVRSLTMDDPFHFQLLPPGVKHAPEPFTLASHTPNIWMGRDEMRTLIADAEAV